MKSAIALAAVVLLLAALVYFLFGSASLRSAEPAEAPAAGSSAVEAAETGAGPVAAVPAAVPTRSEATRAETAVAPPRAPDGLEDGAEKLGPSLDPATIYTARYDGFTAEELAVELARLEREVEAALAREFRALFAAGSFTEIPVEEGETRTLEQIAASAERDGELCESHFVFESAAPPAPEMRPRAVRVACLAPAEHPELEALIAERDFVRREVAGER